MNIYVETNFILELTFMQEQYESCDKILTFCEAARGQIILPAFCIAESYATLIHQAKKREQLANALGSEVRQLSRSQAYKHETDIFRQATALLVQSSHEEGDRLIDVLDRLLRISFHLKRILFALQRNFGTNTALRPKIPLSFHLYCIIYRRQMKLKAALSTKINKTSTMLTFNKH